MFGNRRLAKRSILGTRICAPCQDGRFHPGVIQAQRSSENIPDNDHVYTVLFDNGNSGQFRGSEIVGPGFQQVSQLMMKPGQKVYLTLNGREISGEVTSHETDRDEVHVSLKLPNGEEVKVPRKIDEIRLMESRKSARLLDQDTDYSKLADLHSEPKRRAVSHVIDVPCKVSRARHSTSSSTGESTQDDAEMMDDHMAAMVLTSLSVSPVSPVFPQSPSDHLRGESKPFSRAYADSQYSSSFTSGSFLSSTCRSDRSDPSPPLSVPLSGSAPSPSYIGSFPCVDEGIDLEENVRQYFDKGPDVLPEKGPKKTMFKCTFPRCGKIFSTCSAVEKHVRGNHLEMKEDSSDLSDHEEEFYYTEIEVNVENVTKTFSDMSTSSPPTSSFEPLKTPITDHDYQRKFHQSQGHLHSSSVPGEGAFFGQATSNPIPINMSEVKRSLSWQNSSGLSGQALSPLSRFSRPSPQERLQQHQAQSPKTHTISSSPKSLSQYKKPRSDVRKCRKVYGMENRDMWCTQCKWKKACTRFME